MLTPRIEFNLTKISHNAKKLKEYYGLRGIEIIGVTKAVNGNPKIAFALVQSGIKILADSRILNIKRMREAGVQAQYLLLRTPFLSEADETVKFADISLNSEIIVIKKLSKIAIALNIKHKVILMVELGDLREGIMPAELENTVRQVLKLKGIELVGIGTNLTCFGGVKPDERNMAALSTIVTDIEEKFDLKLQFISGGNSSAYNWLSTTKEQGRVNNLRIGESIYLGKETLYNKPIPNLYLDVFTLIAEVIEAKIKPSMPYGEVGKNAFGVIQEFKDDGPMLRAILGIGLQDVEVLGLTPILDVEILGASSDHLILNAKQTHLEVGNEVAFNLNYAALLSAMTSPYITKSSN